MESASKIRGAWRYLVKVRSLHPWDVTPREAIDIQNSLREMIISSPPEKPFLTVAGADVSWRRKGDWLFAGVALFRLSDLSLIEERVARKRTDFPYIPGLLSFREVPVLLDAFRKLSLKPDLLICDGQGLAHPRRMGLACHLGLLLDIPTIGCAKSRLIGEYRPPARRRGSFSPLKEGAETLGVVLRTRRSVKPLFVSPGHRMDIETPVEILLRTTPRYRLPEPIRHAHHLVNEMRRQYEAGTRKHT